MPAPWEKNWSVAEKPWEKYGKIPPAPDQLTPGQQFAEGFMNPFFGAEQVYKHTGDQAAAADFDRLVQEREQEISRRGGTGLPGMAGTTLNPLNLMTAAAAPAAAQTVGPMGRMATSAITGALGAVSEPVTAGDFASEKGMQALLGAGAGTALGVTGEFGRKVLSKVGSSVEDLEKAAHQGYDQLKNSNTLLNGYDVQRVAAIIEQQLKANHFRDYLDPQTFAVIREIRSHYDANGVPHNVNVGDLSGWQQLFKRVGGTPQDQEAARFALDLFDQYLGNVPASHVLSGDPQADAAVLREAQANWRAARRSDVVDMSIERAERQAMKSGSGSNKENTVRQRIDAILNSKTERKKYSPDEIADMEAIVKGTKPVNALRSIGKFAPTGVVSSLPTARALFSEKPIAATLAAPAVAAKYGAEYMTKQKAKDLAERIRSKAPAYVPPPAPGVVARYGPTAIEALAPGAGAAVGGAIEPDVLQPSRNDALAR